LTQYYYSPPDSWPLYISQWWGGG